MTTSARRFDTPLVPMILGLVFMGAFVLLRLNTLEWDESRFVLAGEGLSDPARVPPSLYVLRGATGYDGQAFYRLALDPLTDRKVDHGITLDSPAYRQQRIGYPGLAWLASGGGRPERLPLALIAINVAAIGAIGWLGGAIARSLGRNALWGLVFPLYPGFVVSVGRDLSEPLATAFLLAGLLLLRRSRATWAGLALTAAILTRETTAVVPLGLAIVWLVVKVRSRDNLRPAREFAVPLGTFALWQLFLYARWNTLAALNNPNATDPPFLGLIDQLKRYWSILNRDAVLALAEIALAAALVAAVLIVMRSGRVLPHERWAFLVTAVSATILDRSIWYDHAHFLRALTEFYVLGAVILIAGMRATLMRLATPVGALWVVLAANYSRNL